MKKKFIVFLIGISFLIFSCASTSTEPSVIEPDSPALIEDETPAENQDENNNTETTENTDETEVEQKQAEYEVPEDFVEPDVQDLELPVETIEEPEITDTENTESVIEEPISSDEIELSPDQIDYPYPGEDDLINNQEENIPELPEESTDTENENALESEENSSEDSDPDGIDEELTDSLSEESSEESDSETEEDDSYEQEIENPEDQTEELIIMPSRSVTLKRGETLEVVYPGSGWIYMGSLSEYNNLASRGRKLGATDTKYTLLAKEAGTQIHHFYKIDNLTGEYIDDYLEVIVLDKKGSSKTTVQAPEYQYIIPPKPETPAKATLSETDNSVDAITTIIENTDDSEKSETTTAQTDTQNAAQTTGRTLVTEDLSNNIASNSSYDASNDMYSSFDDVISIDEDYSNYSEETTLLNAIDTDSLLENAKNLYNEKKYQEANVLLADFFEYSTNRIDEALFLQGQIYESDSPVKDIKKSIENYEALIKNYPASEYWNDANKRIKYLRRFYYLSN